MSKILVDKEKLEKMLMEYYDEGVSIAKCFPTSDEKLVKYRNIQLQYMEVEIHGITVPNKS